MAETKTDPPVKKTEQEQEPELTTSSPDPVTVTDSQGIERIVSEGVVDSWEPAPVDADPEQIKAAAKRESDAKKKNDGRKH